MQCVLEYELILPLLVSVLGLIHIISAPDFHCKIHFKTRDYLVFLILETIIFQLSNIMETAAKYWYFWSIVHMTQ